MAGNYEKATPTPTGIPNAAGRFERGWLITFTTKPSGLAGQIEVVGDTLDPDTIDTAITDVAAKLEAIHAR